MPRSAWKGPYVAVSLLQEVVAFARKHPEWWSKGRFQGMRVPEAINTHSRASVILPDFLGLRFGVHNGNSYVNVDVQEAMVGHRLGEFSQTKKVNCRCVKAEPTGSSATRRCANPRVCEGLPASVAAMQGGDSVDFGSTLPRCLSLLAGPRAQG